MHFWEVSIDTSMQEANDIRTGELTAASVASQWQHFFKSRDATLRKRLIEYYLSFARMLAATTYRRRSDNSVPFDDYLQYARTGLIEAIDRYDSAIGVPFEKFSSLRIRGAILNGIGSESELAAQRKAGLSTNLYERLYSLDRAYTETAEEGALDQWVQKVVGVAIGLLLDRATEEPVDEAINANPYAHVELVYLRRRIVSYISQLSPREADIVRLHYFEHLEFQLVAEQLGISKGRVSQLHAKALTNLRRLLGKGGRLDASL